MTKNMYQKIPITKDGLKKLEDELFRLKSIERAKVIAEIEKARGYGDLSENAEYAAAKERQAFIEGKIQELTEKISRCEIIDPSTIKSDRVVFGCTIRIIDLQTEETLQYQIVGVDEVSLSEGKIPHTSPIARTLIGKKKGDIVEVSTPKGIRVFKIAELLFI